MSGLSQTGRLLKHLKHHKSITPAEAFTVLGIYNFSARLFELKEEGWIVNTVHVRDHIYRYELMGHRDEPEPAKKQGVLDRLRARFGL